MGSPESPQLSYFVATLDYAQRVNAANPHAISTINQLLDERAASTPHLPVVGFAVPTPDDSAWPSLVYTCQDLSNISNALAHQLVDSRALPAVTETAETAATPPTAAILASSSAQFLMTFLALVRIGYSVLLIGPQCTPREISHLLTATACTHIFHSSPLAAPPPASCTAHVLPALPPSSATPPYPTPRGVAGSTCAYIHHTSGTSSGLPTAIAHTHAAATSRLPQLASATSFSTTPLYHGGTADLLRSLMSSSMIWLYPPSAPITSTNVLKALEAADAVSLPPSLFTAVPYVLELCAVDERVMRRLVAMDMVGVGGAPLRAEVGSEMVRRGVKLVSRFGSSECGFLMSSHRDFDTDTEWEYLRVSPESTQLQFTPLTPGASTLELTVLPDWPQIALPNRADGAYITGDLFTPHATIPSAYRYSGRRDATLVLSNGRKLDAASIEAEITARGAARDAVVFGRDRPFPGVLLFGAHEDAAALLAGTIMAEMVVVVAAGEEPPRSSKGVIMRGVVEEMFKGVIDGAYRRFEEAGGAGGGGIGGRGGDVVGEAVRDVAGPLGEDEDLFAAGVDSVMAALIRGRLLKGLQTGATLPRNVVFEQRTIRGLREYISRGAAADNGPPAPQTDLMRRLVDKYGDFSSHPGGPQNGPVAGAASGHVVVLTGATGALGAHLLHQLCQRPGTVKVICLCRAKDPAHARARIDESLRARKLPPRGACVVAYPAALGKPDLGLGAAVYEQLKNEVSVIIHAAWAVNFVASLESFEKDHIAGTRNLADLALRSVRCARLCFCSSTAAVLGLAKPNTYIPEQFTDDPDAAAPLGYARSKWVAEQVCQRLQGRAVVVRIGQLCADRAGGVWNETEAWPLMFASVNVVGCLPELEEKLSWLPVDIAAEAVLDIALQDGPPREQVFHVVNTDTSTSWASVLDWILQRDDASFERAAPSLWVKKLADTEDLAPTNPSRKLLGLWEASYGEGAVRGNVDYCFEVKNTLALSKALGRGEGWQVGSEYVQNIWNSWVQSGFIKV